MKPQEMEERLKMTPSENEKLAYQLLLSSARELVPFYESGEYFGIYDDAMRRLVLAVRKIDKTV